MKNTILLVLILASVCLGQNVQNPTRPGGSNGDIQCNVNGRFGNCAAGGTVSGNLTITGAAYLSSAIVTPGRPGDNTIGSQAGFMVKWDGTNSRWTACDINSTTLCVPTTYTAANSANGTGDRPDGKPACGGGGTVGGAAVCTYTTLSTVTATFDGAVTNGNLACAKSGSTATYLHDCGTAVLASVGSSKQVVGVITSAGSGSPVTASADIYSGYASGIVTAMSGAATTAVSAGASLNASAGTATCVDGSSQLTTSGCASAGGGAQLMTWYSGGATVAGGATQYASIATGGPNGTESGRLIAWGKAGTYTFTLCVLIVSPQNAGGTLVFTLRNAAGGSGTYVPTMANTALSLTVPQGASTGTYCSSPTSVTLAAGSYVDYGITNNYGSGSSATIQSINLSW